MNKITIDSKRFGKREEFYKAIGTVMGTLTENDSICVSYCESNECEGIFTIEFDDANPTYGGKLPFWITEEDYEILTDCEKEMDSEDIHNNVWTAYNRLVNALQDKKAKKIDLIDAMEEAIGYLGEELE